MIMYASVLLVTLVITYTPTFMVVINDSTVSDSVLLLYVLYYEFIVVMALMIVCFTVFHFL
jgi:hypothetical protein